MDKLYQFLTARWLMSGEEQSRLLAAILPALRSGHISEAQALLSASTMNAYATTPYMASRWEVDDQNIPEGSVAVITLEGPLYAWETFRLESILRAAADNPHIAGVVLWINGPGGMSTYIDVVSDQIAQFPKPVAAYVAAYMLSAHLWIGSAAGRIFLASPLCEVGSCGVMTTYVSMREYYKNLGIDIRDIYSDSSDLKNKWFRDIEERDDETLVKERLAQTHDAFIRAVAGYRGIAPDTESPVFRGETFTGDAAISAGLADQYGTLQDAVQWVVAQTVIRQVNSE